MRRGLPPTSVSMVMALPRLRVLLLLIIFFMHAKMLAQVMHLASIVVDWREVTKQQTFQETALPRLLVGTLL